MTRRPKAHLRKRIRGRFALLGLAIVGLLGCDREPEGPNYSDVRGADPWVFRSVLDGVPRVATVALRRDLWVSYETETGSLRRVWRDGVDLTGAVFDAAHGPQPVSLGPAYYVGGAGGDWSLVADGTETTARVSYRGHRYEGDRVVLAWELSADGVGVATVEESPEFIEDQDRGRGLERRMRVVVREPGTTVRLRLTFADGVEVELPPSSEGRVPAAGSDGFVLLPAETVSSIRWWLPRRPGLEAEPVQPTLRPAEALIASAGCGTCHHPTDVKVGPSWTAVATRYPETTEIMGMLGEQVRDGGAGRWGEVVMPAHPQLDDSEISELLAFVFSHASAEERQPEATLPPGIPIVDGATESASSGLAVNLFRFDHLLLTYMPPIGPDDRPAYAGVARAINAVGPDDFGEHEEFFAIQARGALLVEEAGEYQFRLVSSQGSVLRIDDAVVVDHSGYHAATPREGVTVLDRGEHRLEIDYFQGNRWGGRVLSLQWKPPGAADFEVIPESVLRHAPSDLLPTRPYERPAEAVHEPGHGAPLEALHPLLELEDMTPPDVELKVGGMDHYDDRRLIITTWDADGSVWLVDKEPADDGSRRVRRIGYGLAEALGVKVLDGDVYVLQKQELTQLVDHDGDEVIDEYRTIDNSWPVSTNYHEFNFGLLARDRVLTGSFSSAIAPGGAGAPLQVDDRGTVVEFDLDSGELRYVASGLRTPNGLGWGADGALFVTDNQGGWVPTSKVVHVEDGDWFGFPSNRRRAGQTAKPPVVWMPHDEVSNSPSQLVSLDVEPYDGQLLVGDVTHGGLKRVFFERVGGAYQGAVFRFSQGFRAGINRLIWGEDGWLYVGGIGSPGNWGQEGKSWDGIQRVRFTGEPAFEVVAMRATVDGFTLEFTEPLASGLSPGAEHVRVEQWRYEATADYGGAKQDQEELTPSVSLGPNRTTLNLSVPGLNEGSVVYVRLDPAYFTGASGRSLWTSEAWYTLNARPRPAG